MAKIEISGEVVYVGAPVKYSDKFTKAEIVVKDSTSKYPEFIKFEAINDKVELMRGYPVGTQVIAEGFVGGKEYQKKEGGIGYITSIKLAKIYENKPAPVEVSDAIPF
jgi:hypothetical protein